MTDSDPAKQPVEIRTEITCPQCGHCKVEQMPQDACQFFYECEHCRTVLRPKAGDCCVFCSYGTIPCPPIQLERAGVSGGCCSH
jgi:hypothetical protein